MDYNNNSYFLYPYRPYIKLNSLSHLKLQSSVLTIPQIGEKYQKLLEKIGIFTVSDLLFYFPKTYHDSSAIYTIRDLNTEEVKTFKARVIEIKSQRTRKRKFTIQTAILEDNTKQIESIWFNQPFLTTALETNNEYLFSGKLNPKSYKPQILSPEFEEIKPQQTHLGRITPIYSLTKGISNKWLRSRIKWLVEKIDYIENLHESMDKRILKKYKLLDLKTSLSQIHFPQNQQILEKSKHRFAFEELLNIQIELEKRKKTIKQFTTTRLKINQNDINLLKETFKHQLTRDQEKAIKDILADLNSSKPMNRLLSGDVGSGKTIVAIAASLVVARNHYQTAILAPTTVLAKQHFETFKKLLKPFNLSISLITNQTKLRNIKKDSDIFIGTHAILFKKHDLFSNLNLMIIDEQHRFGVEQREDLRKTFTNLKTKETINLLMMTATPIPRTLALTLFNDLDVTQIQQKPKMRLRTKTFLINEKKRSNAIKWLKEQATNGTQIFWIAPLIEESENMAIKSVTDIYEELQKKLPDLNIEILHGKLNPKTKDLKLTRFKQFEKNKIHILVSTSVIEVGIDIPNANIIVIEGAERFGLAQLHQLRGRVGRSDKQSWCFLFTSHKPTQEQYERLNYFCKTSDGFQLAEFDLKLRGPGEVYGTKQTGIPDLKFAKLNDMKLIKQTKEAINIIFN